MSSQQRRRSQRSNKSKIEWPVITNVISMTNSVGGLKASTASDLLSASNPPAELQQTSKRTSERLSKKRKMDTSTGPSSVEMSNPDASPEKSNEEHSMAIPSNQRTADLTDHVPEGMAMKKSRRSRTKAKREAELKLEGSDEEISGDLMYDLEMEVMDNTGGPSRPNANATLLKTIQQKSNPMLKLTALQDLSEILSVASEDMFCHSSKATSNASFNTSELASALISVFQTSDDELLAAAIASDDFGASGNDLLPDLMLLSCRCLSNLLEANPMSSSVVVQLNGVEALVQKLTEIQYIDLAEQVLTVLLKLSNEYPSAIVKANGIVAILQYIDFFSIPVQRSAMGIAANSARALPAVFPPNSRGDFKALAITMCETICRFLSSSDAQIADRAIKAMSKIVDWLSRDKISFEDILSAQNIPGILSGLLPSMADYDSKSNASVVFITLLRILSKIARTSATCSKELVLQHSLFENIASILTNNRNDLSTDSGSLVNSVLNRPTEHTLEILSLASSLMPNLPSTEPWKFPSVCASSSKNPASAEIFLEEPDQESIRRLADVLLPLLFDIFGATVNVNLRRKCTEIISKCVWFTKDGDLLQSALLANRGFGKCLFTILSLQTSAIRTSATDMYAASKDSREAFQLVVTGMQILSVVIDKCENATKQMMIREGIFGKLETLAVLISNKQSALEAASDLTESISPDEELADVLKELSSIMLKVELAKSNASEEIKRTHLEEINTSLRDLNEDLEEHGIFDEETDDSASSSKTIQYSDLEENAPIPNAILNIQAFVDKFKKNRTTPRRTTIPSSSPGHIQSFTSVTGDRYIFLDAISWLFKTVERVQKNIRSESGGNNERSQITSHLQLILNRLSDLEKSDDVEKQFKQILDSFSSLAKYIAGSESEIGLSGYELSSSGIVEVLLRLLSESPAHVLFAKAFRQVFLDEQINAFERFVSLLQETLSQIDQLDPTSTGSGGNDFLFSNDMLGIYNYGGVALISGHPLSKRVKISLTAEPSKILNQKWRNSLIGVMAISSFKMIEKNVLMKINSSTDDDDDQEDNSTDEESEIDMDTITSPFTVSSITPVSTMLGTVQAALNESRSTSSKQVPAIDFKIDGKLIPLNATVFGVLHRHLSATKGSRVSRNEVLEKTHEITFEYKMIDSTAVRESEELSLLTTNGFLAKEPLDAVFMSIVKLLRLMHSASSYQAATIFQNDKLAAKLNRQLSEPFTVISDVLPEWCSMVLRDFKFLLPFQYRLAYVLITAFGPERGLIRWQQLKTDFSATISNVNMSPTGSSAHGNSPSMGFGRIGRRKLTITRDEAIQTMREVIGLCADSREMIEIEFVDEVGTGVGPTLEFYSLVCNAVRLRTGIPKEDGSTRFVIWRDDENSGELIDPPTGLYPVPISMFSGDEDTMRHEVCDFFQLLGRFVARSLMDARVLDLDFSQFFLSQVLNNIDSLVFDGSGNVNIELLRQIDPTLANSMATVVEFLTLKKQNKEMTVEGVSIDDLALDMTLPGYPHIELVADGKNTPVTTENVEKYLELIVDASIGRGVQAQVASFRKGMYSLVNVDKLHCLTTQELSTLIGGTREEDWGYQAIREAIKANHGYNIESKIINDFIKMLTEFDTEQRRMFLEFVTGSPKLPIGGFKCLSPPLTIVRKAPDQGLSPNDYLPSVMTCVNYLKLPEYKDATVMFDRFVIAMNEGRGSFHLS